MATRGPDSPRETGDVSRGSTPGDVSPQGGRGRMDEVTGRMSYAQGPGGEAGTRRMGRDFYREALARISRRGMGEEPGRMGYGRGEEERGWGRGEGRFAREGELGYRGYTEYEPRREMGARGYGERGWEERGYGEEGRGREGYWGQGRPMEGQGRGGTGMDMDEMARRYRTDLRFDREAQERGTMRGEEAGRWEGRGYGVRMREEPGRMGMERMERREERRRGWQREPLTAGEVMTPSPKTLHPDHTLRDAARLMREENVGIVPVTDAEGRLQGVVTDRDIVVRAIHEDRVPSQTRVADFMSEDLEVVTSDESLHDVIELMGRKQVRRIPVVERDNRLLGIVSVGDIATKADYDEELQGALERISSRRSFWRRLFS